MVNKICFNKPLIHWDWCIRQINGSRFTANNGEVTITFEAEYKNGLYYKIICVHNHDSNRTYSALRYFNKYYRHIVPISFVLFKKNYLWDYQNNQSALKTYKKDITPYYNRCKELGLSFYDDEPFIEELFK